MTTRAKDHTGKRYGRVTVLAHRRLKRGSRTCCEALVRCDCGREYTRICSTPKDLTECRTCSMRRNYAARTRAHKAVVGRR